MSKKILFWFPRILGIGYVLFISMFAFDVFGEGYPWYEALLGFLIHLVPAYAAIAILLVSWKWPRTGSVFYLAGGIFYIFVMHEIDWIAVALISGPLFLTGALFFISYYIGKDHKKEPSN